ncbi:hypothetical protein AA0111_g12701 [Alternaria arborescens]|nr:hypothetical protein AA0111_g12701 [Alternaria arborescens]RYO11924.1 hypothetical protein AA0111_g12701 [Alternaria arborescens]
MEAVGANLKRLSLTTADPQTTENQLYAWAMGEQNDLTRYTPRLEELRLSKMDFSDTFEQLSRIIDFHRLIRLELLVESCGLHLFIKDLANSIYTGSREVNRLQLKHIAVEFVPDLDEREAIDLRDAMELIITACGPIESFHMRYPEANPLKITLLDFLQALSLSNHNLQSLSIYCDEFETLQWDGVASDLLQWVSVSSLSKVKQLAVYCGESAMLGGDMTNKYTTLLQSLRRFPQLRLLHLHVPDCDRLGRSEHNSNAEWDSSILSMQLQTFANQLFGDLHGAGAKLDALVIGHLATVEAIITDADFVIPLPQQCFVKGEQRDILGRTVAVGVPVTRMMLHATQPYTDILDIDHPRTHDAYDAWAGKAM